MTPVKTTISGQDTIHLLVASNPKRYGSHAHEVFQLYEDGMCVNDFVIAIGERRTALQHIRFDAAHNHIRLEYADRKTALPPIQPKAPNPNNIRSQVGTTLTPEIRAMFADPSSWWAIKRNEIMDRHLADLGGHDACTEAERCILKRAATLTIECERMEARLAATVDDPAPLMLEMYARLSNTLRRLLDMAGLERRRPRDITPSLDEYLSEAAE